MITLQDMQTMANEFSQQYLFEHKETAKESYIAALKKANLIIDELETAFEACNNERKEYRDKMDFANAALSKAQTIHNEKETPRRRT